METKNFLKILYKENFYNSLLLQIKKEAMSETAATAKTLPRHESKSLTKKACENNHFYYSKLIIITQANKGI